MHYNFISGTFDAINGIWDCSSLLVYEIKVSPYIWWNWDSTSMIFLCYFSSFFFITLHLLFSQCGSAFQCKKHPAYSNRLKSNCILMCFSFHTPFHLHMFAFYHFTGCNIGNARMQLINTWWRIETYTYVNRARFQNELEKWSFYAKMIELMMNMQYIVLDRIISIFSDE